MDSSNIDQYYNPWDYNNFYNYMLRKDGIMVTFNNEMALKRFMNIDKYFRGVQSDENKDFIGPEELYDSLTHQTRVMFIISNNKQRKDMSTYIAQVV